MNCHHADQPKHCAYGGGTLGRNPFDMMHFLSRVPQGSVNTIWSSMRGLISYSAMAIVLGQHVRVGNEDNLWGADRKRKTSVEQIEGVVRICKAFGRKVATAEEARKISKVGTWYNSVEETLQNNGLPPNPTEFNPGFLTWPTDGKKAQPVMVPGRSRGRSFPQCLGISVVKTPPFPHPRSVSSGIKCWFAPCRFSLRPPHSPSGIFGRISIFEHRFGLVRRDG